MELCTPYFGCLYTHYIITLTCSALAQNSPSTRQWPSLLKSAEFPWIVLFYVCDVFSSVLICSFLFWTESFLLFLFLDFMRASAKFKIFWFDFCKIVCSLSYSHRRKHTYTIIYRQNRCNNRLTAVYPTCVWRFDDNIVLSFG